jgi:hypothetical protein
MNSRALLQSRKRKLSELFSIVIPVEDPTYKQKLQAFHDANNLERYANNVADIDGLSLRVALIVDVL